MVKSSVVFDKVEGWICPPLTDEIIKDKLNEQHETNQLFAFCWGVWCTAFARKNLFMRIIECKVKHGKDVYKLDVDLWYDDTDSLKMENFEIYKPYFDKYNQSCIEKMIKVAKLQHLDFNKFIPKDKKGIAHPLGVFDFNDGDYSEFCTLGSKRYCYRDTQDDNLHISISGVNKKTGLQKLKDNIYNFKPNIIFDYDESGKLCHTYIEGNEPYTFIDNMGNEYTDDWGYGVVLKPTKYKMSFDEYFELFIDLCEEFQHRNPKYFEIAKKSKTRNMKGWKKWQ